jgi:hypothetical protein
MVDPNPKAGVHPSASELILRDGHMFGAALLEATMRGILLWAVGIPLPIILILYFLGYL